MTLAPHSSPDRRLRLAVGAAAGLLALGGLSAATFGWGPSAFLFALAGVALVDALASHRSHRRLLAGQEVPPPSAR